MEFDVIYSDIDIYTVYTLHSFVTKLKKGYFIKQERRKLAWPHPHTHMFNLNLRKMPIYLKNYFKTQLCSKLQWGKS